MPDWVYNPFFVQGLGFIAFAFGIWAFLQKDDRRLKVIQIFQCLFLVIHFIPLGAPGGAAVAGIAIFRNMFALRGNMKRMFPVFILAYIILGYWSYTNPVDILPVIGSIVSTICIFLTSGIKLRLGFAFGSGMWIAHNIIVHSYGPLLMELVIFSSLMFTIFKIWKNKPETPPL